MNSTNKLTVLYSQRSLSDPTNPYSGLLFESLRESVNVRPFSWKTALLGRYDILHLQWPEYVVREKRIRIRILNLFLSGLFSILILVRRIPVVETVHNRRPHEFASRLERLALQLLCRRVDHKIYLNKSPENDLSIGSVILHGHYKEVLENFPQEQRLVDSRYFLFFGLIRPYKGMENLIAAFKEHSGSADKLVIAGFPPDQEYRKVVEDMARKDDRILLDLRHIPESTLHNLVTNALCVVLPYDYMYNSGALIYALSAGTPVLAPASPANDTIRAEVGNEWLSLFADSIGPGDLRRVAAVRSGTGPGARPDLSLRSWQRVAQQHVAVYINVVGSRATSNA